MLILAGPPDVSFLYIHPLELTWIQRLLSFGVTGAERAVQLEVVDVVEEGVGDREENVLKKENSIENGGRKKEGNTKGRQQKRNYLNTQGIIDDS